MHKFLCFLLALSCVTYAMADDFVSIFDGKTLKGWQGNEKIWKVSDGILWAEIPEGQSLKKNEFIYWEGKLEDFELKLEYRISGGSKANSGIQIRSGRDSKGHAFGYQADLDDGTKWLGRIYDEHGRRLIQERGELTKIAPDGKRHVLRFKDPASFNQRVKKEDWNTYHIKAVGHRIEIRINGELYSVLEDYQVGKYDLEGLLALQMHSGRGFAKVEFKNIQFRKLPKSDLGQKPNFSTHSHLLWDLKPQEVTERETHGMSVPPGFVHEVVINDQEVRQPIAFTFDARGRIWVAEAMAYPIRKKGQGEDRLVIYEDQDGDGSYEHKKIFIDNLNLISGFEIGYGGVFVAAAPEFLFIPDANLDDIPDGKPQVLLDGWSIRDTHETQNSFLWGHDGWLYGTHGVFNPSDVGKPGTPKNERVHFRAGVWRYHPTKHEFEVYAHGGSNPWGLDYNEEGELFMTHCRSHWGKGPVSQVFRDGIYWTQNNRFIHPYITSGLPGWRRSVAGSLENMMHSVAAYGHGEGGAGFKGSKKIFGGHSHVGTMVYLGDNWPEEYRGQLYTHNLHGKRINREYLERYDSAYLSYSYGRDQSISTDKNHLVVDLKTGPDGAVYSIDWVDQQKCHSKKDEVWDKTSGRVYRMAWKASDEVRKVNLYERSHEELVAMLNHSNEWHSRMAQHLLRQAHAKGEVDQKIVHKIKTEVLNIDSDHRFRKLIALMGVGGLTQEVALKLLTDPNDTLRKTVVEYVTEKPVEEQKAYHEMFLKMAQKDDSARVRLALASACRQRMNPELALTLVETLAVQPKDRDDRFIPRMLWYASVEKVKQDKAWAYDMAAKTTMPILRDSIYWYLAKSNPDEALSKVLELKDSDAFLKGAIAIRQSFAKDAKHTFKDHPALATRLQHLKGGAEVLKSYESLLPQQGKNKKGPFDMKEAKAAFALCTPCHLEGKPLPGPSLEEIVKVYSNSKDIISWVKKPGKKRANYPQMPSFEHLDERSLNLISKYLLSLKEKKS